MPIYEYECRHCKHTFDLIEKMSDLPTTHCPACAQETAERLVSAAGFQLKGNGWYVTDFKDKKKPDTASSSAPSENTSTINKPSNAAGTSTNKTDA